MTIAAAWFRKVNNCEELWFISDSRLCGGHRWDECPKIFPLQRSDCAISFAGDTGYAYPMMMQTYFALGELSRIKTRAMDIVDLNGYVLKHINFFTYKFAPNETKLPYRMIPSQSVLMSDDTYCDLIVRDWIDELHHGFVLGDGVVDTEHIEQFESQIVLRQFFKKTNK